MGYVTKQFAKRLKELRDTAGLTQTQLAEQLKVSRGAISYYEKGERTPDIEFLDSLAQYFELPYDFVLGVTNNVKVEYRDMFELYGLTDAACYILDRSPKTGQLISAILGHENFLFLKHTYQSIIENYKSFNENELGYISFLLSDALNKIIFDALEVLIDLQFTPEEKRALHIEREIAKKEFDDTTKEWEERERIFREKNKNDLENLAKIDQEENQLRYSAIEKVHEKFYKTIQDLEFCRQIDRY